jgi:DNA-binding GntR family transcriptional regulator
MTMTNLATLTIRNDILIGKYLPGAKLIPQELVSEKGLGISAIRDALRELTGFGLVDSIANKGTYVTQPPTFEEIVEIFKLRTIVEVDVAEEGAKKISSESIKEMEELHKSMGENGILAKDHFLLNRQFHMILYKVSGRQHLCKIINLLFDQVLLFRSLILSGFARIDFTNSNQEHQILLQGLKEGDIEMVKATILTNIKGGLKDIQKHYQISQNC